MNANNPALRFMNTNLILAADSYKTSQYPIFPDSQEGLYVYIEARSKGDIIVPAGIKAMLERYLSTPITQEMIDEAEQFITGHGEPFNREGWEYILNQYGGWLPFTIRAIPEGMPVPSSIPLFTVECSDKKAKFAATYIETWCQRGVWYPTTIASQGYEAKKEIKRYYEISGAEMSDLAFGLLDFAGRGFTCGEQAQLGTMAHMYNWLGTDTMEGVLFTNNLYGCEMAGFSVPASEHNNQISFGEENEYEYVKKMLDTYAKPGKVVSIVIDGYNAHQCVDMLCEQFGDFIKTSGALVCARHDSGLAEEQISWLLNRLAKTFGYTINAKGYKKLNCVKVLWGDGINQMTIRSLYGFVVANGWAANNITLGSGGGLMQSCTRDTYKFAMKGSAQLVNGVWKGMSKRPITDPGKRSKEGRVAACQMADGSYGWYDLDIGLPEGASDIMETIYDCGKRFEMANLDTIRARTGLW
jgi:nicotinamide phosphoribosyltransferase